MSDLAFTNRKAQSSDMDLNLFNLELIVCLLGLHRPNEKPLTGQNSCSGSTDCKLIM